MKFQRKASDNRVFYDNLIRVLFVELNLGGTELNPDLILPTYHAMADPAVLRELGERQPHWCTIAHIIGQRGIDFFDQLLRNAPADLKGCRDLTKIRGYLKSATDFTDCQLTAANALTGFDKKNGTEYVTIGESRVR